MLFDLKYTNSTMQIFYNGLLETNVHSLMSEKYLHFRNRHGKEFFPQPVEVTRSMHFRNIFEYLKDRSKILKEIGIIHASKYNE